MSRTHHAHAPLNPPPPSPPVQRPLWRRFLVATGKVIAGAAAMIAGLFLLGAGVLYLSSFASYLDLGYEKHHEWNGIEVGTLLRTMAVPNGRHRLVISFPVGRRAEARALFVGLPGELPEPLDFVRADGSKVTYKRPAGEITLEISGWTNAQPVTASSPRPKSHPPATE